MANQRYILDTNIISALLKKNAFVQDEMASALHANAEFLLCPLVYYEVRRGLLHRGADKQLLFLDSLIASFRRMDYEFRDWVEAAEVWAHLRLKATPIEDADILIGVFARRRNAIVVTGNPRHFQVLPDVQWVNWGNTSE